MKINPKIFHLSLIAYCIFIFILSSIPGDNFPEVDFKFSDKIVHVIVYAILFTLFFYSLKNQQKNAKLHANSSEFALLFTSLYGITDELHQYFVPKRSCEFSDWIADLTGALLVYTFFKFNFAKILKFKNYFLFAAILLVCGCSSSDKVIQKNKINIAVSEQDVWLNLMPVLSPNDNILGFLISLDIEDLDEAVDYDVKDLDIYFNNDTLRNVKFQIEKYKPDDFTVKINVSQSAKEMYLDKNKIKPETARIDFTLNKYNKKIKTIKTRNLKILKVY